MRWRVRSSTYCVFGTREKTDSGWRSEVKRAWVVRYRPEADLAAIGTQPMEFLSSAVIRINGALQQMMGDRWRLYSAVAVIVLGIAAFSALQAVLTHEPDQQSGAERIMGEHYYDADRPDS